MQNCHLIPSSPPRPPAWDAIALLYRRRQTQTETCETIAEVLHSVPMRDFTHDDFDTLRADLDEVADWGGDHHDLARSFAMHEVAPILFGAANGVIIYEDGLRILRGRRQCNALHRRWSGKSRSASLSSARNAWTPSSRRSCRNNANSKRSKRWWTSTWRCSHRSSPQVEQAINVIAGMSKDDAKFAACRTVRDYIQAVCTDPPAAKADGDNHDRSPF